MKKLILTYYHDITQGVPTEQVRESVVIFSNALGEWISSKINDVVIIEVPDVMSVPEQYDSICSSASHIALMKPVAYVLAHQKSSNILPACVAHRPIDGEIGTFYFAQVYAHKNTGLRALSELLNNSGKYRIAYGDRFSTSNFLIPANQLKSAGIHPFMNFKEILFTGGHDLAAKAVYEGLADLGAGHDGAIKILASTYEDAEEKLIQISRENIHSDPVVVNTNNLPAGVTFDLIQQGCTEIAKTEAIKKALDVFWGWVQDLSPTNHENYSTIESAISNMHLTEKDILS